MNATGIRPVKQRTRGVDLRRRPDGSILLRSPELLDSYPERLTERFAYWASHTPDRVFIAERDSDRAWRTLRYGEAYQRFRAIGAALLARELSADRPIAILSDNDIEHALLALAAMHVGIPYVPISSAYSLVASDLAKLRYVMELLTPGLVFVADASRFARAIDQVLPPGVELVAAHGKSSRPSLTAFTTLERESNEPAVDRAFSNTSGESIAKFLLTSGSTANPKAVINTQRMICANQQMIAQSLPNLADEPPVLVDWLPWNHTFGGNHNFGLTIWHGGSLYIDEGKPTPALFEASVCNLREVAPTVYFNVPRGFEELAVHLRRDPPLRRHFFSRLQMMFYAGAGLAQPVWDALDELAIETCGHRILWVTGLGATETGPSATFTVGDGVRSGMIGLPVSGVEVKLAPEGEKLEMRVRGPSVTPGYWRAEALTAAARDEEGFHRMGDAVRFVDPNDPAAGLLFDGRIAEDFKLSTGTWVSVGPLRARFIAAGAPWVQDVVITGLDRDWLGALIIPNIGACRELAPDLAPNALYAELARHPAVIERFQRVLNALAAASTGSSTRIVRAILLDSAPSLDAGEITDKGSINQRATLAHRQSLVTALYAQTQSSQVVVAHTP